jgi:hypothetical protein
MKATKPIYYPDPVIFDKERLIFARFDGSQNPSAFNVPIYFSNEDVLKNKVITGISVKTPTSIRGQIGATPVLTDIGFIGTAVANATLAYFTITLVGRNGEVVLNDYPLMAFNNEVDDGKIRRTSMMIDLSKSFIRNFGIGGLATTSVIPISFFYKDK